MFACKDKFAFRTVKAGYLLDRRQGQNEDDDEQLLLFLITTTTTEILRKVDKVFVKREN